MITSAVFKTNVHVKVIDAKKHKHLTIPSVLYLKRLSYGKLLP